MTAKDFDKYYDTTRPFHLVKGAGTGSVTILIRKNTATWLYRLFRFGEFSRYVKDSRGLVLVYNKISEVAAILDRKRKVHAMYESCCYDAKEWSSEKYNLAWDDRLHRQPNEKRNPKTAKELIKDPYCSWVAGYKAHFVLERPTERRKHVAFYNPVKT